MAINKREMNYRVDFVTMTLTMTAEFADKAYDPQSSEYGTLTRLQKDFPGLTVVRKTHRKPKKYVSKSTGEEFTHNQFKDLTYKRMEQFMNCLSDGEIYLAEYRFIRNYASEARGNGYPLVRKWFVAQFPEFRKNPMFYLYNNPALVNASDVIAEEEEEGAA